jgi:hypothetical protein
MHKQTTKIAAILTNTALLVLITARADAYQLFTNRDSWNSALQNIPIITEDFKNSGFVTKDTVFSSGFKFVDSGFLGGARVSEGSLEVGLAFPGSLEEFAFPNAVKGFGFDFTVGKNAFIIEDSESFGSVNLGNLGNSGFFGVLASDLKAPILGFKTISPGELGTNVIRNLDFTKSDTVAKVPEPNSALVLIVLTLGLLVVRVKSFV